MDESVKAVMRLAEELRAQLGEPMQGYDGKTTEEQARAAFRAKFGREPARCTRKGPIWLAGPVRGNDADTN